MTSSPSSRHRRRRRNVRVDPSEYPTMIGRGPRLVNRSACGPTRSFPSRYRFATVYVGTHGREPASDERGADSDAAEGDSDGQEDSDSDGDEPWLFGGEDSSDGEGEGASSEDDASAEGAKGGKRARGSNPFASADDYMEAIEADEYIGKAKGGGKGGGKKGGGGKGKDDKVPAKTQIKIDNVMRIMNGNCNKPSGVPPAICAAGVLLQCTESFEPFRATLAVVPRLLMDARVEVLKALKECGLSRGEAVNKST